MLTPVEKIGLALMIFVLMLGMGSTLSWADFQNALKKPRGLLIGFLSQFGLMPAIAYTLAIAFQLPNEVALSLVLVGATPGGTTSNLFTYFSKGDVALSISMTVSSSFGAVFMMPLVLYIYASQFTSATFTMPYGNIVSTILITLIPVAIGMFIRKRSESAASKTEKAGSWAGIFVIAFLLIEFFFKHMQELKDATASIYLSAILLGIVGFLLGYILSRLLGLTARQCRTVSLETGIQNTPLTMAIIVASFPVATQSSYLLLPLLYAVFIVIDSILVTGVFTIMMKSGKEA